MKMKMPEYTPEQKAKYRSYYGSGAYIEEYIQLLRCTETIS